MAAVFKVPWEKLALDDVQVLLDEADDEPLLWEAKGTDLKGKEVRRQVCAFANSHEGGYLILGASNDGGKWVLDGVKFDTEPRTWITDVIVDPESGVRPRPAFDVHAWKAPVGHVAVVRIDPTPTPPCIANGTVYERLPGKTQVVRDPQMLAGLFSRGDAARNNAYARADQAAIAVLRDGFGTVEFDGTPDPLRCAVGVAATGNRVDISSRLFTDEFAQTLREYLRTWPGITPPELRGQAVPPDWSQEALIGRHLIPGPVAQIVVARASRDGAGAAGVMLNTEQYYPDQLAAGQIADAWRTADKLVTALGGYGDVYVTVLVRSPKRAETSVAQRGPLPPGVKADQVASIGRELTRAFGLPSAEPSPPAATAESERASEG